MTELFVNPGQPIAVSQLLAFTTDAIRGRLPSTWRVAAEAQLVLQVPGGGVLKPDLVLVLTAPDGTTARLVVEAKLARASLQTIELAGERLRREVQQLERSGLSAMGVVAMPYLSPAGRRWLRGLGIGYADATGNLRLQVDKPAVFIESPGADRDPWPQPGELRSLKGPSAASAIRALTDFRPPFGIRQLASRAGVSPATLSRVTRVLEREALVVRRGAGAILNVDWEGVVRRWVKDYEVSRTNRASSFLDPRGITNLTTALQQLKLAYAVSGTLALPDGAAIAPPRLALVYSPEVAAVARATGLTQTDRGANVLLLEPYNDVVFARARQVRGLTAVALPQVAADLLTSPGRGPSEAEELIVWMRANEDAWRA